jgi:type I restriction enzyme S subunit
MKDLYKSGRVASYDSQSTGISNFQYEAFVNNELLELPNLEIQTSVASALVNLQSKIINNSQISKTLEAIAQTMFKSWFIDFDPVKAKMEGENPAGMDASTAALFPDSMVESELGLIPKGWSVENLGDVCEIKQGRYLSPSQMSESPEGPNSIPVIGGNGVLGYTATSTFAYDVPLITCRGSKCGLLQWANYPSWISNNAMAVSMKSSHEYSKFLHLFFQQANFENVITGSAQPQITITNLSYLKIVVPSDEVLRSFTNLVENMRKEVISLSVVSNHLAKIRDSLLPRLISGELQIPDEMLAS